MVVGLAFGMAIIEDRSVISIELLVMSLFLVLVLDTDAAVGRGDGGDWEFDIYLMNDKIFHLSLMETSNGRVSQPVVTSVREGIVCVIFCA